MSEGEVVAEGKRLHKRDLRQVAPGDIRGVHRVVEVGAGTECVRSGEDIGEMEALRSQSGGKGNDLEGRAGSYEHRGGAVLQRLRRIVAAGSIALVRREGRKAARRTAHHGQ